MDVVELVVAVAVVRQGGVVALPDVVDLSAVAVDLSVAVVVAAVASLVEVVVVDSHPVDAGEVDTKRLPERFTFTTKTPGRADFPCRGMTLDITDTNRYHEHSTAFGSSMGFLVHVEHGAMLEKALEHCVRMIVISRSIETSKTTKPRLNKRTQGVGLERGYFIKISVSSRDSRALNTIHAEPYPYNLLQLDSMVCLRLDYLFPACV